MRRVRPLTVLACLLAIPALLQLSLVARAIAARYGYPYDLEWMEGGMLTHALQLTGDGGGIYRPPSVEFIPFLYTPLYPALIAALSTLGGVSYQLARGLSILATLATLVLAARIVLRAARGPAANPDAPAPPAWPLALSACALYAACYPWLVCFFDLARADALFLAMAAAGLVLIADVPRGGGFWQPRVALAALLLGGSFFAKQTGVLVAAAGGAALLLRSPRAVPLFAVITGAIGLGGTAIANAVTDGWFWIYVFQVHQNHDTHLPRFWESFGHILGHLPVLTGLVAATLVALVVLRVRRVALPRATGAFLYWAAMFAVGTVIGAVGWSTQWAVFNAFMPAMAFGAIAAGLGALVLAQVIAARWPGRGAALALVPLALVAAQLLVARWQPSWAAQGGGKAPWPWQVARTIAPFVPTDADRAAGDALIAQLRAIDGDIFYPSHPFYPVLAGKSATFAHRIGVKDVTFVLPCQVMPRSVRVADRTLTLPCMRKGPTLPDAARTVAGLTDAGKTRRFGAVVLDSGEQIGEYPGLGVYSQREDVPKAARPRVFTGKPTQPAVILRPRAAPNAPVRPAPDKPRLAPDTPRPAPAAPRP